MLEDPGFDHAELAAALLTAYGIEASTFTFIPAYDPHAASYQAAGPAGSWFLKVHRQAVGGPHLEVPRALRDAGIANVLAPIRTQASTLWHELDDGRGLVLYPFVAGRNAIRDGLTADQWRTFGTALQAVHDSDLADRFSGRLSTETFALPSAAVVRSVMELAAAPPLVSPAGKRLVAFLEEQRARLEGMLDRAEGLGERLRHRSFEHVLCHADIHAGNILLADDGRIFLIDWDGPMLAPRERDLLFVIGSRIARDVEPREETWFFEGYGDASVDPEALVYYRYERILEDIGEIGRTVLGDPSAGEASRAAEVDLLVSFFGPGGILETVEVA